MYLRRLVLLVLPTALAAACAPLGPNYQRPDVTPPPAHRDVRVTSDQARSLADMPWVDLFKEPELSALVREALDRNLDLRAALWRIEELRGRAALSNADLKPFVGGQVSTSASPTQSKVDNVYNAGLFFNWEIDFFGRLRRAAEASQAEYLATEWGTRAVMTSVVTDVAELYVSLRALDEQLAITRRTITSQEEWLVLVRKLERGGVASSAEVAQAQNQVSTTRAVQPEIERQIILLENALSVLVGRTPSSVLRASGPARMPVPPEVPAGLPSQLLERRPDIVQAELQLRVAVARIGVAVASKIPVPRIGLTSSFGRFGSDLGDYFGGGPKAENLFSFGPFLQIPIYDGGAGKARVQIAQAQAEQAAVVYKGTFLQSLREVADSLGTIEKVRQQIVENEARVQAAQEYLRLTDLRYRGGVSSYLEVLDAQRQLFAAEIDLADARRLQLVGAVQLYRALGGGWSDDELKRLAESNLSQLAPPTTQSTQSPPPPPTVPARQ
jgi:multidrug efflux system outer membrane protein